jgi:hypothetical protein
MLSLNNFFSVLINEVSTELNLEIWDGEFLKLL